MIKNLVITGYKPQELGIFDNNHLGIQYIKKAIKKKLINLLENTDLEWVIISGQLGVELWAGEVVLELKEEYEQLKLAVMAPFFEQEANWKDSNKELYYLIWESADFHGYITKYPYQNPSQLKLRTKFLLSKSDALLILYDDEKEGSPKYILNDAKKKRENEDYEIFTITSYDLQEIVEEEQYDTYVDNEYQESYIDISEKEDDEEDFDDEFDDDEDFEDFDEFDEDFEEED